MIHLIAISEKRQWNKYLDSALDTAFCQTHDYHLLEKDKEAFLFVYEEDWGFIAIPFLKRLIPNTVYYDLTSVYGYGGPISNLKISDLSKEIIESFEKSFLAFLTEKNIVSIFLRLNPFSEQNNLFKGLGGLFPNGRTVAIDLTLNAQDRRRKYRENVRVCIRKCKEKGYFVKEVSDKESLSQFLDIYWDTMQRKSASEFYFFNEEYFSELLASKEFESKIYIVYDGDIPICGTFIICYKGVVHAHLIGTSTEYLKDSPAKFMVDAICDIEKEKGMKFYHLGSGLGFKEDSLFEWKKGFSDLFLDYYSWRFIPEESLYLKMVKNQGIDPNTSVDFFPLYRYRLIG